MKTTRTEKVVHFENKSGHIYFRPTTKDFRIGDYDITILHKNGDQAAYGTIDRDLGKELYKLCKETNKSYTNCFYQVMGEMSTLLQEPEEKDYNQPRPSMKQERNTQNNYYDGFSQSTKVTMQDLEDEIKKYRNLWRREREEKAKLEKLYKATEAVRETLLSQKKEYDFLLPTIWEQLLMAIEELGELEFLATVLARRYAVANSNPDPAWDPESSVLTNLCYSNAMDPYIYDVIAGRLAREQIEIPQLPCGTKCFACTKLNCLECSEYNKNNTEKEVK